MSKATIVFKDNDDGTVSIRTDFEPDLDLTDEESMTAAQYMALLAVQAATGAGDRGE